MQHVCIFRDAIRCKYYQNIITKYKTRIVQIDLRTRVSLIKLRMCKCYSFYDFICVCNQDQFIQLDEHNLPPT